MDPWQLFIIAPLMVLGACVQSIVGFAFGALLIPLFLWLGLTLPEAVMLVVAGSFAQLCMGYWELRRHVRWDRIWLVIVLRIFALGFGIWLLSLLVTLDKVQVRQVVGVSLLIAIAVRWGLRVRPRTHVPVAWTVLASITSGIMGGMVGMGGPLLVLWVGAHRWTSKQSRAAMFAIFLSWLPLVAALLWYAFGTSMIWWGIVGLAYTPLVYLGSKLGLAIGRKVHGPRLRQVFTITLILIALAAILEPIIRPAA